MNDYDHNLLFYISPCSSSPEITYFVHILRIMLLWTAKGWHLIACAVAPARTKMWEFERASPVQAELANSLSQQREEPANRP
jgi:hypothetical protein